ncbi:MBL fold metallo-hydrolase [Rhizobium mongolense]|uniref:MBL fold metallo-hydrolase n=1 Tax=Rhizobium mongolense TaxID=57676 RepID=UPI00355823FA
MQRVTIERTQHAVGHGGFHTGIVRTFEPTRAESLLGDERPIASLSYVYDCGSEQNQAFNSELSLYRSASNGRTDLLFVSHLHSDHINGLDRLQAMAPAKTVVAPYLDLTERLLLVLSDFEAGKASASGLEYFRDPVDWWQRRGAEHIVFLQAGSGDDVPPPRAADPDGPVDDPRSGEDPEVYEARKEKKPGTRIASYFRKPRGAVPPGLEPAKDSVRDAKKSALLAGAGSAFQVEWRSNVDQSWQVGDWILLPYVHPVDDPARRQFLKDLKKALKIRGNDQLRLSEALVRHLLSFEKTKQLVEIYRRHFGSSHNSISMSLFSGPSCKRSSPRDEHWDRHWHTTRYHPHFGRYDRFGEALGWLGTGDATLRQLKWRDPLMTFFAPFADEIGIMTLPHHGSAHNFHPDILDYARLATALATTVEKRNRVAGIRETLGEAELRGIDAQVVDDARDNRFKIHCERMMR